MNAKSSARLGVCNAEKMMFVHERLVKAVPKKNAMVESQAFVCHDELLMTNCFFLFCLLSVVLDYHSMDILGAQQIKDWNRHVRVRCVANLLIFFVSMRVNGVPKGYRQV